MWAKTNVPYYAGDHQTYNDVYGITNNPWDLTRTSGGSSGGAAVAVACGFTTAEIGSDIGNSIRQPAGLNGIFGLKTTYGLVSGRGHIPGPTGSLTSSDLGVFGPLGRSCGDLRILLEVLTNSGSAFGGMPGAELPRFEQQPDVANLRIGVWSDDAIAPVDSSVKSLIEDAARQLSNEGAEVDSEIRPAVASSDLHRNYMQLLNSTLSPQLRAICGRDSSRKLVGTPNTSTTTPSCSPGTLCCRTAIGWQRTSGERLRSRHGPTCSRAST